MINKELSPIRPSSRQQPTSASTKPREIHPTITLLASLLDDAVRIPGTKFRIGLDGLIGLIPVAGDVITLLLASFFLKEAERLGVSRWTKARMCGNYLVDMLLGLVPVVGDVFDFAFKAHRRNFRLLQDHLEHHPVVDAAEKRYAVDWISVSLTAIASWLTLTIYMFFVPRWFGMEELDLGLTFASLTAPEGETSALINRAAWTLGICSLGVLVYAGVLRFWQKQSTMTTGMGFGLLLWLIGPMLAMPALLSFCNLPHDLVNPGIFMLDLGHGWTPAAIVLGVHLLIGIVTGIVYKHRQVQRMRQSFESS